MLPISESIQNFCIYVPFLQDLRVDLGLWICAINFDKLCVFHNAFLLMNREGNLQLFVSLVRDDVKI